MCWRSPPPTVIIPHMQVTTNGAPAVDLPGPLSDPAGSGTPELGDEREDIQEMAAAAAELLQASNRLGALVAEFRI